MFYFGFFFVGGIISNPANYTPISPSPLGKFPDKNEVAMRAQYELTQFTTHSNTHHTLTQRVFYLVHFVVFVVSVLCARRLQLGVSLVCALLQ